MLFVSLIYRMSDCPPIQIFTLPVINKNLVKFLKGEGYKLYRNDIVMAVIKKRDNLCLCNYGNDNSRCPVHADLSSDEELENQ
jgi:hypothetical protein